MPLSRFAAGLCLAAGVFVACGGDPAQPPTPVVTSITLSATSVTFDALGATQQITATVRDQNGQPMSATVTWASADGAIASVNGSGLVEAEGNGSTTITASAGTNVMSQSSVTVGQVSAQVVKVGGDAQSATVGSQLPVAIEVEIRDSRGNPVPGGRPNTTVTFAAGQGGSVAQDVVIANAAGRASTLWTLGNGSGAHQVSATVAASITTQFSAAATAGPADTLAKISGDNQNAPVSAVLPESLVVRVADQFGNPVPGHVVTFATSDGGTLSPTMVNTGANGRAASAWTLGSTLGPQTATATAASPIVGSPATFTATGNNLLVATVSPDTIVENASATITGTGFDPTPANNTITIGGVGATVTLATTTSLTVTVPAFDCQPARSVNVQVRVGGANSNTVSHPLNPATFVTLATGQQQIILNPSAFCLQFAASAASEAYLIGVQSLSETPSNLTPTRLRTTTGFPSPAPSMQVLSAPAARSPAQAIEPSARDRRIALHREAEQEVRRADERILRTLPRSALASASPAVPAVIIPGTVNVGDTVKNVRVSSLGTCAGFDSIAVVVRAKGARGIWVADVDNPANGYTAADFDSLSNYLDNVIFDTDTSYFGDPGDLDGNDRMVIVVTKEVNQRAATLLGFVTSCDFFSRALAPNSNEGEFFYAKAPDPGGTFGSVYSRADAFADAPPLIAHEFTHIIQFGRRLPIGGVFTSWLLEGQATLAEEVNGFAVTGRSTGQNYGFAVAFNSPPSTDVAWHRDAVVDLALYYGFETPTTRKAQAPHECTWIGRQTEGNNGPCISGREVYGVPYWLYRWVSDQFGPGFAGGERGLQKAIIGNTSGGYANLAAVTGVAIDTLQAQWGAMLYVDDRVGGAAARLTLPSWNLVNIENGLVLTARLQPTEVGFTTLDLSRTVRAGSTAYFRISGAARPSTAVRVRSPTDAQLPGIMNLWIVRLQ